MYDYSAMLDDSDEQILASYYPNRRHLFLLPILVLAFIGSLWICVETVSMSNTIEATNILRLSMLLGFAVFCVICCRFFYDTAQQVLCCTCNGIYILHDRNEELDFLSWDNMSYVYVTTNFKGHTYWIISEKQLTKNETRRLATNSSWLLKIHVDQTIILWDNGSNSARMFFLEFRERVQVINHM